MFNSLEKRRRLLFAMNNIGNDFHTPAFIDESSIWTMRPPIYHHRRPSSLPRANAIRPPHSDKVHIWGGVTWDGPIPPFMFDNILTAGGYEIIINEHLVPFMRNWNGGRSRILQDNAPTHVTAEIYALLEENGIRWVKILNY